MSGPSPGPAVPSYVGKQRRVCSRPAGISGRAVSWYVVSCRVVPCRFRAATAASPRSRPRRLRQLRVAVGRRGRSAAALKRRAAICAMQIPRCPRRTERFRSRDGGGGGVAAAPPSDTRGGSGPWGAARVSAGRNPRRTEGGAGGADEAGTERGRRGSPAFWCPPRADCQRAEPRLPAPPHPPPLSQRSLNANPEAKWRTPPQPPSPLRGCAGGGGAEAESGPGELRAAAAARAWGSPGCGAALILEELFVRGGRGGSRNRLSSPRGRGSLLSAASSAPRRAALGAFHDLFSPGRAGKSPSAPGQRAPGPPPAPAPPRRAHRPRDRHPDSAPRRPQRKHARCGAVRDAAARRCVRSAPRGDTRSALPRPCGRRKGARLSRRQFNPPPRAQPRRDALSAAPPRRHRAVAPPGAARIARGGPSRRLRDTKLRERRAVPPTPPPPFILMPPLGTH